MGNVSVNVFPSAGRKTLTSGIHQWPRLNLNLGGIIVPMKVIKHPRYGLYSEEGDCIATRASFVPVDVLKISQ